MIAFNRFAGLLGLLFLLSCSSSAAAPVAVGTLLVDVAEIDPNAGGRLRVALFRGEQGWPKLKNALQVQEIVPTGEQIRVRFSILPLADDYAIEIHHDENSNGKFDMRWLPYPRPKEGVGVSNNSFGFGHPGFSDARFSVDRPEQKIQIRMRY